MEAKILIVDDSKTDQIIISNMLSDFDVLIADDGMEAILLIENNPDIDLIILDLNMPKMNGFEVLKILRAEEKYSKIRTIILTNFDEIDNEIIGLKLGAVDYIRKPINLESLRIRIGIHLRLKSILKKIEQDNEVLEKMVAIRTRELVATRDITIHALVGLLEVRNIESSNHSIRTQEIMKVLCEHLRTKEKYKKVLTDAYIDELVTTSPLHDIGKVGIPDRILLKPGKLTKDEFEIMKQHVPYGVNALKNKQHDESIPSFIRTSISIVATHHEKYNGTGYPLGLAGDTIPLPGRLMAIIDVYDALISKRVYKPAYKHAEAIEYIKKESGEHFDPDIVCGFIEIQDKILKIACRYMQEIPKEEA
jgi:putative two-component system response regulator